MTTSATAMASWAVTFVTADFADRRPLGPSDVVAASVRPVAQVPTWVYGVEPVFVPATTPLNLPAPAGVGDPPAPVALRAKGSARVGAAASHPASKPSAELVARWSPTRGSPRLAVASVTPPVAEVFVPAPAPPTWSAATASVALPASKNPAAHVSAQRLRRWWLGPSLVLADYRR